MGGGISCMDISVTVSGNVHFPKFGFNTEPPLHLIAPLPGCRAARPTLLWVGGASCFHQSSHAAEGMEFIGFNTSSPQSPLRQRLLLSSLRLEIWSQSRLGSPSAIQWASIPTKCLPALCTAVCTSAPTRMTASQAADPALKDLTVCWGELDTNIWERVEVFKKERLTLIFS